MTLAATPAVSVPSAPVAPLVTDSVGSRSVDAAPPSPLPGQPSMRSTTLRGASVNEETLLTALSRGSIDAGRELIAQLENRSERSHDLVSICRRVAYLLPGDGRSWTVSTTPRSPIATSSMRARSSTCSARSIRRRRLSSRRSWASRLSNPIAFTRCSSGTPRRPRPKRSGSSGAALSTCSVAIRRVTA